MAGRAERLRARRAVGNARHRRRRGPVHQDRSRYRQAARRAVAAGVAAAAHARLPRRVQRGVRVRHDRRQDHDHEGRHGDRRPEARRARGARRHLGRGRPREGDAAPERARPAVVVVDVLGSHGRRGVAAARGEPARRGRGRRRDAARAEGDEGPARADVRDDYRISGSWSDPVVERVSTRAPPAAPGAPPAAPCPQSGSVDHATK